MIRRILDVIKEVFKGRECPRHPGHRAGELIVGTFPEEECWCSECYRESEASK